MKALPRHAPHAAQVVTSSKPVVSALHDDSSSANDAVAVDDMVNAAKKEARTEIAEHRTRSDILNALHKAARAVALPKAGAIKPEARKQATVVDPKEVFALTSLKKAVVEREKEDSEHASFMATELKKRQVAMKKHNVEARKLTRVSAVLRSAREEAKKEEAKKADAKQGLLTTKVATVKAPLKPAPTVQMGVKQEIHQFSTEDLKRLVAAEKERKQAQLEMKKTKTDVEELSNTKLKALVSAAKKAEGL